MLLIYTNSHELHKVGAGCPETPDRLEYVNGLADVEITRLLREGDRSDIKYEGIEFSHPLGEVVDEDEPEENYPEEDGVIKFANPADEKALKLYHSESYIWRIKKFCAGLELREVAQIDSNSDNWFSKGSYRAATAAVGAAIKAADYAQNATSAFAVVRPPGHHAHQDYGSGFCIFNNVAIATEYLVQQGEKVMIVDVDLHLGDGTLAYAEGRDNIFYFSINHDNLWPYQQPEDTENTEQVWLPEGTTDGRYIKTLEERLSPAIDQFNPKIIAVSIGFDTHTYDRNGFGNVLGGGFNLTAESYKHLNNLLIRKAIPYFLVLEGGYSADSIKEGVQAFCDWA